MNDDYAEIIESFVGIVEARDWVSFAELRRHAETHGLETRGDLVLEAWPNAIVWADMTQAFVDVVNAIREDGRLVWDGGGPLDPLAYIADGEALTLPVAKRKPRDLAKGYTRPRWLPTFFRLRSRVEAAEGKDAWPSST
jgi:hypothetical protein